MKNRLMTLSILLWMTTIVGSCAGLPADYPHAPVVTFCAPVLTGKKGDPDRKISHWRCRKSDEQAIKEQPATFVQIGFPIEDYETGQAYRRAVEEYFKTHRCVAK